MAIRPNRIEYVFDTRTTSLAAATRHEFSSITLHIPETSNRDFKSVILEVTARSNDATAISLTSWLMGIKLGGVAFSDTTVSDTIASAEHMSYKFKMDVTSYFRDNFGAGTSQTCQVAVAFGGASTINITARLKIVYDFEDAGVTTRVKTASIPFDSPAGTLTDVLTEIGSNQVPNLSTYLPEASVSIKDIWFLIEANEASSGTTAHSLGLALDAEVEHNDGLHENALNSSCYYRYIWRRPDLATNATHAFKARGTVTGMWSFLTVVMFVTYTYDEAATSRMLVSRVEQFHFEATPLPTVTNGLDRVRRFIKVPEKGTISLKQSGFVVNFDAASNNNLFVKVGSQSGYRTYTHNAGTTTVGGGVLGHRIDASAANGSGGLSLSHGINSLDLYMYAANAGSTFVVSGYTYLNYECDKPASGTATASQSLCFSLWNTDIDQANRVVSGTRTPSIPETDYWIDSVGLVMDYMVNITGVTVILDLEATATEGDGWRRAFADNRAMDSGLAVSVVAANVTNMFKRHPADSSTLFDIEGAGRFYRAYSSTASWKALEMWATRSAVTYTVSGTLTGYSGNGSGITVEVFDPDDIKVGSTTTGVGGTYSVPVYDQRPGYYAVARQDSTRVGRSDDVTPS